MKLENRCISLPTDSVAKDFLRYTAHITVRSWRDIGFACGDVVVPQARFRSVSVGGRFGRRQGRGDKACDVSLGSSQDSAESQV